MHLSRSSQTRRRRGGSRALVAGLVLLASACRRSPSIEIDPSLHDSTSMTAVDSSTAESTLTDSSTAAMTDGTTGELCGNGVLDPGEDCDDGDDDDTDDCLSSCEDWSCGDGFTNAAYEECDDGNVDDGDGCSSTCARESLIVFVTLNPFPGDLTPIIGGKWGLELADAHCQALADEVYLPGEYRAWLSDDSVGPAKRFGLERYDGLFKLVDGTIIAEGWSELVSGELRAPINIAQNGHIREVYVWTNTNESGAPFSNTHCVDWTSASPTDKGARGLSSLATGAWTASQQNNCSLGSHLYCFSIWRP